MRLSALITGLAAFALLCFSGSRATDTCAVTLRFVDDASGRELPGLLRVVDEAGKQVEISELLSRGFGLRGKLAVPENNPIHRWSVLPKETIVQLPRGKLTLVAFSGLETELSTVSLDLTGKATAVVSIRLTRFDDLSDRGFRSANTHLHLMKITRDECDRYLIEVPQADGLDALFLSYLERAVADQQYTSNRYTDGDLKSLSQKSGTRFGNGEEHRHNMAGYGQGYGHVMLLNIKKLILPVSIGPGIMKMGTDGLPLRRGIDTAHRDGATVIWCHNDWGMEDLPNLMTGRLDAQNIFDGGSRNSYKDSFYRYLNIGLQVPFSTGTDWFMYDFSRVYADMQGDVTVETWLKSLSAGRSFITNGPLLEFTVSGKKLGETVSLENPGRVHVVARARSRVDFERIELVQNGKVIAKKSSRAVGGHFEANLTLDVDVASPCWLALRTPPPPVKGDPQLQTPVPKNELGRDLFAHTSAIFVELDGRRPFNEPVARALLAEMQANVKIINEKANFADNQERSRVLDVHHDGIAAMKKYIATQRAQ